MTTPHKAKVLYLVVCGAGPAAAITVMIDAARQRQWDIHVIATPAAVAFFDPAVVEQATGHPVRSAYRRPDEPRHPRPGADAVIIAPATFNTINKLAAGISDTYALGMLAELIGTGIPIVVLPFINSALAARRPLSAAVARLEAEDVTVLLGPSGFQPHPPGHGDDRIPAFPWLAALDAVATPSVHS